MTVSGTNQFPTVQEQLDRHFPDYDADDARDESGTDVMRKPLIIIDENLVPNEILQAAATKGIALGTGCRTKLDSGETGFIEGDTDTDTDADTDTDTDTVETGPIVETGDSVETGQADTAETGDTGGPVIDFLRTIAADETDGVFYGEAEGDEAGTTVTFAGDVDGDGSMDLFIGAPKAAAEDTTPGVAYLVSGPLTNYSSFNLEDATAKISGESASQEIGRALSGPGDVNGDGFADLLVGNYANDYYNGAAHLYLGPVTGAKTFAEADQTLLGSSGEAYGYAVQGVGDLDGSGYPNVAVSEAGAAKVYVYSDFPNTTTTDEAYILEGYSGSYAGTALAAAGDVNGDGYGDLVIGAYEDNVGASDAGAVYLVPGNGTVDSGAIEHLSDVGEVLTGEEAGDYAGYSVAAAGDTNYDGYDDIIVGAPNSGLENGAAYLVLGGPALTSNSLSDADARLYGASSYDYAGWAVSGNGSVDGDEYDDIVVGVPNSDATISDGGEALVFLGPVSGYHQLDSSTLDLTTETFVYGLEDGGQLASSLGSMEDADGDGTADIPIGESGNYQGVAHLLFGSSL